ncbi:hypothetical protein DMH27_03265 [Raoultella planticola]|nr:hypothetical protein [Raoultella planticola]
MFRRVRKPGQSWCAAFVSYCFNRGATAVFGYQTSAQALHNKMKSLGYSYTPSLSNPPQPGDIICWLRVDPKSSKRLPGWGMLVLFKAMPMAFCGLLKVIVELTPQK